MKSVIKCDFFLRLIIKYFDLNCLPFQWLHEIIIRFHAIKIAEMLLLLLLMMMLKSREDTIISGHENRYKYKERKRQWRSVINKKRIQHINKIAMKKKTIISQACFIIWVCLSISINAKCFVRAGWPAKVQHILSLCVSDCTLFLKCVFFLIIILQFDCMQCHCSNFLVLLLLRWCCIINANEFELIFYDYFHIK